MQQDLTQGSIRAGLIRFSLPLIAGNLLQQLYNVADTLIVGRFLGNVALAAVGSAFSLMILLTSLILGLCMGSGVVFSQLYGEGSMDKLKTAMTNAFCLIAALSLLLTVLSYALLDAFIVLLRVPPEAVPDITSYLRVIFAGTFFTFLYNFFAAALRSVGNSLASLLFLLLSTVVNIALDLLFIGAFRWGVWSAALATTISQFVSTVLCILRLMRGGEGYKLRLREVRLQPAMLREIIRYGLPSGVQNSIIAFANVIVQSNINVFGPDTVAGCGTYSKLEGFAFLPITCYTMALTTFVSQNLGAGKYDRAKKGSVFGIVSCVVMAEVIGVLMLLLARPLLSFFTKNQAAIAVGERQIQVEALFFCMLSFSHCIAAIMRGAGRPMVPMFVMLGAWCVLRVTYISVVVPLVGESWVIFSAYPLTWTVSSIVFLLFYLKSDWIHGFDKKERAPAGRT